MAAPSLAFLQLDALVPLENKTDLKDGFSRVPLTLSPPFSGQVAAYSCVAPANALALSVGASSFAAAALKINNQPGSLLTLPLAPGFGSLDVPITLHDKASGAELARTSVAVSTGAAAEGETVLIDRAAPVVSHGHSHDGVPCDGSHHAHGHGHGEKKAEAEPGHGHSHGGVACADPSHAHGAAGHGHAHSHGHGHGTPLEAEEEEEGGFEMDSQPHFGGAAGADGSLTSPPGCAWAWGQDRETVTVEIPVPPATKAAECKVTIGAQRLEVAVAGQAALSGATGGVVVRDDSTWSLVQDGAQRKLTLQLAKAGGAGHWRALLA